MLVRGVEWPPTEGNKASANLPRWQYDFEDIFKGEDADDYFKRCRIMTRYTGTAALLCATTEIIFQNLKGVPRARVAAKWAIPFIGGGIAYCSTVAFLGGVRNKTQLKHHFLGGVIAGSVWGAYRKKFAYGLVYGILLGITGVTYKETIKMGWHVVGEPEPKVVGFYNSHKYDWTFMKEYPSYWVRKAPEEKCD